jgi:peptide/nickel transport system substrate-binding protein
VPVSELAALLQIGDPNLTLAPPEHLIWRLHYPSINTVDPNNNGALQKLAVRQALAYAVDKAAIVQDWGGPVWQDRRGRQFPNTTSGFKEGADQSRSPNDRGDS